MNGKHSALYKFPSWEDSRDPGVSDAHAPITWTSKQFASAVDPRLPAMRPSVSIEAGRR